MIRALLYSSHPRALVVPLPNPSCEPKLQRWRTGAVERSREVPSQICAILSQKQALFWPKRDLERILNSQTKGNSCYTSKAP